MIVHYAGVSCDMDKIMAISKKRNLKVVEDAAQAIESKYKGKCLGTIGDFGCLSFHDTKNITCGEGGALFINTSNKKTQEKAEIIREKGTNRSKFFRGEIDKYTWVETGSSYLPSDILAAYLLAQLENSELITKKRMKVYDFYKRELDAFNTVGFYKIPVITKNSTHNAHIFYIVFNTTEDRDFVMSYFKKHNISAPFHYIPLHSAPRGVRMGYKASDLPLTEKLASCLIRLPIYSSMTKSESQKVVRIFKEAVKARILDVNSSKNSEVFIEKPRYSFVRNIFATLNLW